jgi:hypothetical protein
MMSLTSTAILLRPVEGIAVVAIVLRSATIVAAGVVDVAGAAAVVVAADAVVVAVAVVEDTAVMVAMAGEDTKLAAD